MTPTLDDPVGAYSALRVVDRIPAQINHGEINIDSTHSLPASSRMYAPEGDVVKAPLSQK